MKKYSVILLLSTIALMSCNKEIKNEEVNFSNYEVFGEKIKYDTLIVDQSTVLAKYASMQEGDTIPLKFTAIIEEVCQKKGCWLSVNFDKNNQAFVKFKDYTFFAPMNAAGHKIVLDGKAFVSIVSVDELRHYAKDAGKSEDEIAKIVDPEISYSFLADGVAIESVENERK